jgi:hypothetical protein
MPVTVGKIGSGAGVIAALVMSAIAAVARGCDIPLDHELWIGSALTGRDDDPAWFLGLAIHVAAGGVFGALYARFLDSPGVAATLRTGAAFGALHAVIAGLALSLLPAVHPLMPDEIAAPGAFASNLGGIAALLFIIEHVAFGSIVGAAVATASERQDDRAVSPISTS